MTTRFFIVSISPTDPTPRTGYPAQLKRQIVKQLAHQLNGVPVEMIFINQYNLYHYELTYKLANKNILEEKMTDYKQVNMFTNYSKKENHFTNGLISIMYLANQIDDKFIFNFNKSLLELEIDDDFKMFTVQENYLDAIIKGERTDLYFETKIRSATLDESQIEQHIDNLKGEKPYLVLLTPDDTKSQYIKRFISLEKDRIVHLEWKKVYDYLQSYDCKENKTLKSIIDQFIVFIAEDIFKNDIVGIIAKMTFGENSGVNSDEYLDQFRNGEWKEWNNTRKIKHLDGTGRKLLLFDKSRGGITVEVEINRVEETKKEKEFPWTNSFAMETLKIFDKPIPLERIESLVDFSGKRDFTNFKKERTPYRLITHKQYEQLTKES